LHTGRPSGKISGARPVLSTVIPRLHDEGGIVSDERDPTAPDDEERGVLPTGDDDPDVEGHMLPTGDDERGVLPTGDDERGVLPTGDD
jgi:hypothetical protein